MPEVANQPETQTEPELSEQSVAFLTQEIERMLSLYSQAQANAQSVFNFYLTFVTAVLGAIIFVFQVSSDAVNSNNIELIAGGLLFFVAIVGSVYLSALSGRYAHAARYARTVDAVRLYLIQQLQVPMPALYERFLVVPPGLRPQADKFSLLVWLMPTGTYQMFIAMVNSSALAAMIWLISEVAGVEPGRGVVAVVVIFLVALTVYNVYSRLIINTFTKQLHVRIDMERELPMWAARQ